MLMKFWIGFSFLLLGITACTVSTEEVESVAVTAVPNATVTATMTTIPITPTTFPTDTAVPAITIPPTQTAVPTLTATPQPIGFAALPNNIAAGETAVDFPINTIGGKTIALSGLRGNPVLLLPTVPGCGECMLNLNILDAVYPEFRGQGIQIILLDLYPDNSPGYWEFLANQFPEADYIWGVAASDSFVIDYDITTLGTILLLDPAGNIVFRSEKLIPRDEFHQLLAAAATANE